MRFPTDFEVFIINLYQTPLNVASNVVVALIVRLSASLEKDNCRMGQLIKQSLDRHEMMKPKRSYPSNLVPESRIVPSMNIKHKMKRTSLDIKDYTIGTWPQPFITTTTNMRLLPFALSTVSATQLFYNSGTRDGWDYVREEHNGVVEEVTNVFNGGPSALKMTQTFDEAYTGRYHSEVDVTDGYQRGDTRFYGFSFRLSDSWEFTSQGYNIAQFIANREGAGCGGDDWMPSSMIWIDGDQLTSRIVSGSYRQPDCGRDIDQLDNLATVSRGVWHKVILQVSWASEATGEYKIWFDGDKLFDRRDVATTVSDDEVFQFRVGLYANSWYDDGYMEGNQPFRQIWYDDVAIGTEYGDVNV